MERAAAEVTSAAGKSFIKVIGRVANAWSARLSAKMEAEASEIKKDIAHAGALKRAKATLDAERQRQFDDIEHAYAVRQRALGRLSCDLIEEQQNIEKVINGAAQLIENDPDNDKPRDPEPDWLRRFFNYASQVDEESVLKVFMSALADAAISGRQIIPAKALDTLRFFTKQSFESFMRVAKYVIVFGYATTSQIKNTINTTSIEEDIELLLELGLIKTVDSYHSNIQVGNFHVSISYDIGTIYRLETLKLTQAGISIVRLVDKTLGSLQSIIGFIQRGDEVWELQRQSKITPEELTTLANELISNIHDSINIQYKIQHNNNGVIVLLCDKERRKIDQPFLIRTETYEHVEDSDNKYIFDKLIEAFDRFDRETLPAMVRHD